MRETQEKRFRTHGARPQHRQSVFFFIGKSVGKEQKIGERTKRRTCWADSVLESSHHWLILLSITPVLPNNSLSHSHTLSLYAPLSLSPFFVSPTLLLFFCAWFSWLVCICVEWGGGKRSLFRHEPTHSTSGPCNYAHRHYDTFLSGGGDACRGSPTLHLQGSNYSRVCFVVILEMKWQHSTYPWICYISPFPWNVIWPRWFPDPVTNPAWLCQFLLPCVFTLWRFLGNVSGQKSQMQFLSDVVAKINSGSVTMAPGTTVLLFSVYMCLVIGRLKQGECYERLPDDKMAINNNKRC